jgi:predicted permease
MMGRRKRMMEDLDQDIRDHIERETQDNIERGMPPEEAHYAALRKFGNVTRVKEEAREVWSFNWLEHVLQDIHYGLRMLRKSPGFTAAAVLTLALGIGANAAMFSVVNAVLLRPLPFSHADRLVRIYSIKDGINLGGPSPLDAREFARRNSTFDYIVSYDAWRKNLSIAGEPEQVYIGLVPAEYFQALDIQPLRGRLFTAEENEWGNHHVAVITASLWRTRFGGDDSVLGKNARINDEPYTIVGVVPDSVPDWMEKLHTKINVWTPFAPFPDVWAETNRESRGFTTIARLKPGITIEKAKGDLQVIAAGLAKRYAVDQGMDVTVEPLVNTRVGNLRPALLLLMGAVGLILLIACSNVANLLLARNSLRQREFAIRGALGAGQTRLVRQLLTESLLLSFLGGGAGAALAWFGIRWLAGMRLEKFPQLAGAAIDPSVLLFTLSVAVLTSVVFGVLPAIVSARARPSIVLKEGGRTSTGARGWHTLRRALAAAEVGLSLMLLIGASLLIESLVRLQNSNLGFRADHLLTEHLILPDVRYSDPWKITQFCEQFAERARAIPGVRDVTITDVFPPSYNWKQPFTVIGRAAPRLGDVPQANFGVADPHYLKTLEIPLLSGRDFTAVDTVATSRVTLINETLARRYFPNENPVGKQIEVGSPEDLPRVGGAANSNFRMTIIGVVGDTKNRGLALDPDPDIIALYQQNPEQNFGYKSLVVRTAIEPWQIAGSLRRELHALDGELPFAEVRTMDEILAQQTADGRFSTSLLTIFAGLGLILTMVGVYGVISFAVSQRTHEIGVRIALGAQPRSILRIVLGEGMLLTIIGITVGICGAFALTRFLASLLFDIKPTDPVTFAGVAALLLIVALAACYIPARRAMHVDPMVALRYE